MEIQINDFDQMRKVILNNKLSGSQVSNIIATATGIRTYPKHKNKAELLDEVESTLDYFEDAIEKPIFTLKDAPLIR